MRAVVRGCGRLRWWNTQNVLGDIRKDIWTLHFVIGFFESSVDFISFHFVGKESVTEIQIIISEMLRERY